MEDIKLTKNFGLKEFYNSDSKYALDNHDLAIGNLSKLTLLAEALEAIRGEYGCAIIISSGVRCPAHNAAIGGSLTSQHTKAEAVDFTMPGANLWAVYEWIVKSSGLHYGQVIYETAGGKVWIHYSLGEPYRPAGRCRMALVFKNGKYETYTV